MKRRNFLATTGIALATSTTGLSAANSVYSSLSTNASLEAFAPSHKKVLNQFISELEFSLKTHHNKHQLIQKLAMPVRILSQKEKHGNQEVTFKNRLGNFVRFSVKNGEQKIYITNDRI